MKPLSDRLLGHLQEVLAAPELAGTRYEAEAELGRGGMGIVYAVRDRELDRLVALKVLQVTLDEEALRREARTIAGLEHPGIVPLYDAGRLADGRFYYTMRLVAGQRLDAYLAGGPALADRLRVFDRVAETARYAHSRGIVHCDLKPGNIMVGSYGEVFVLDWGVARALAEVREELAGTPRYMAPEQRAGGRVDARTDVYALGRILKEMAGPASLQAIARKAAAEEPDERYPDVAALEADLARFRERLPVTAYRETMLERAGRFAGRNQTLLLLLGAYLVARIFFFLLRRL